jgi:hypothetical protein
MELDDTQLDGQSRVTCYTYTVSLGLLDESLERKARMPSHFHAP